MVDQVGSMVARNIKITERTQFSAGSLVGERFVDTRAGVRGAGLDGNVVPAAEIALAKFFSRNEANFANGFNARSRKKKPKRSRFKPNSGPKKPKCRIEIASV
jgi:hypothetical protein